MSAPATEKVHQESQLLYTWAGALMKLAKVEEQQRRIDQDDTVERNSEAQKYLEEALQKFKLAAEAYST